MSLLLFKMKIKQKINKKTKAKTEMVINPDLKLCLNLYRILFISFQKNLINKKNVMIVRETLNVEKVLRNF